MKVLVCGSRVWTDTNAIVDRIRCLPVGTIVIEGEALGADQVAARAARSRGLFVAKVPVEANHWDIFGLSAGHKRNAAMLDLEPGLVIAFQVDGSSGTQGTIDEARRRGIPVEVHSA